MALNGRCACGFAAPLCPTHHKPARNENKVTCREVYFVGAQLVGVTVLERREDQKLLVRCACGGPFEINSSVLTKARAAGTTRKCPKCRTERKPSP